MEVVLGFVNFKLGPWEQNRGMMLRVVDLSLGIGLRSGVVILNLGNWLYSLSLNNEL